MSRLVCIVCPRGCTMEVTKNEDGTFEVAGNSCKRGKEFAISEQTMPMRTICSTAATAFRDVPVIPVRVSSDIPKEKIFDVMKEINNLVITERVGRGDTVIENVLGLGVDVIATSNILKQKEEKK